MVKFNIGIKIKFVQIIYIFLGAFVSAAAFNLLLIPAKVAPGGISGLASAIGDVTNGFLPVGILILVFNIPLFFFGYKCFGKQFLIESVIGTAAFSVMTDLLAIPAPFFLKFLHGTDGMYDRVVCAIWGGVLMGIGLGLVFRGGATTGGTDIMARLIYRKSKAFTTGELILILDAVIIVLVAIIYGSFEAAMYSGIAVFISSKMIDVVEAGVNYAREIIIVTSKPDELALAIMNGVSRGVTKLSGVGMHSKNNVSVLMCVIYKGQLTKLQKIISEVDSDAFVTVSDVRSVVGEFRR